VNASTIQNNQAIGFDGQKLGGGGGSAYGGGIFVVGTASLTNVTLSSNTAQGGKGGVSHAFYSGEKVYLPGGWGEGGGLYVGDPYLSATLDMHNCVFTGNSAIGGLAQRVGIDGKGEGGGLFIDPLASVCLDALTLANFNRNKASTSGPDIDGSYTICP
jgi:hypothetical protein